MASKKNEQKALVKANKVLEGEILPPESKDAPKVDAPVGPTAEEHKAIDTSVRAKIAQYLEGKQSAHLAVIEALGWAAKHGDAHYMNVILDLLGGFNERPTADAENLRLWTGRKTAFEGPDGKPVTWMGFNTKATETKKAGFYVKSGVTAQFGRALFDELALKQGPRFMDRVAKAAKPADLETLLKLIAKFPDTVGSKEKKVVEAGSVPLPESLKRKLMEAAGEATTYASKITKAA